MITLELYYTGPLSSTMAAELTDFPLRKFHQQVTSALRAPAPVYDIAIATETLALTLNELEDE